MTGEAAVWFFVGVGVGLALAMFGFLLLSLLDRRALRRASQPVVEPARPAPPKRARLPRTPPVDAAPPLFGARIEPVDLLDDPIRTLPQELLVPEPETLEFPELDFSDPEHHVSSPRIEPRATARTKPGIEPVEPSLVPLAPTLSPVRPVPTPEPEPPAPAPQPGRSGRRSVFDAAPVERPARLSTPLLAPREPKAPVPPTTAPPTPPAPTTTLPPAPVAAPSVASSPLRFPIDTPPRRPFTEIVVPTPVAPQPDAEPPVTTTVAPARPATLRFRSATTTTARPHPTTTVAPTTTPAPVTTPLPTTSSAPIVPARPTNFSSFRAQRAMPTTTPAPVVTEPPPPPGSVEAIFAEAFSGDQEPSDGKPES